MVSNIQLEAISNHQHSLNLHLRKLNIGEDTNHKQSVDPVIRVVRFSAGCCADSACSIIRRNTCGVHSLLFVRVSMSVMRNDPRGA